MKFPEKKTAPAKSKREKTETGYILDGKEYRTHFSSSDELCEWMAAKTNGQAILAFSCGKDSICAWLKMREYFTKIVPVYLDRFPVPPQFVVDSIEYYQDYFGQRIYRLPHPDVAGYLRSGTMQSARIASIGRQYKWDNPLAYDRLWEGVRHASQMPDAFTAIGERIDDNHMRRVAIKAHGAVTHTKRTFYPIFDYKKEDILKSLQDAKIKLPPDYRIYKNTIDGIDYRYMKPLKDNCPVSYDWIKTWYPFVEADLLRIEYRKRHWEGVAHETV
jgi:hypothetical protein